MGTLAASASERPPHLARFTPDWVSPALTLNEVAKLQHRTKSPAKVAAEAGVCSGDVGLPPIFAQRGQRMLEARVAREQFMEGLKHTYVAERRRRMGDRLAQTRARREILQATSGQAVLSSTAPASLQLLGPDLFASGALAAGPGGPGGLRTVVAHATAGGW